MREVNVSLKLNVPATAAWAVLSDFAGFLEWAGGGEGEIRVEGHGVGMIRHLRIAVGELGERLLQVDDTNRTMGYGLAYGEPLGMQEYRALVQVIEQDSERCELRWHGMFEGVPGSDEDAIMDAALEAGADDVFANDDGSIDVLTAWEDFVAVKEGLISAGMEPESSEVTMVAATTVELDADGAEKIMALVDHLEDLDDVQNVYTNAEIPEEVLARMG